MLLMAERRSRMRASWASAAARRTDGASDLTVAAQARAGSATRNDRRQRFTALAALLGGMGTVQLGASLAKLLFPVLGSTGTACLRVLLAAIVLVLIARPWRQAALRRPDRRTVIAILAYGVSLGVMNTVFYGALARLPLGITVAIEFLGPLSLAVLGSRRGLDLLWAGLAVAGLLLLVQPWQANAHRLDPVGVLLALAAGLAWALYILTGRRVGAHVEGGSAAALGMAVAALVVLPLGFGAVPRALAHPAVLAAAFAMAMLSSAIPYSIEMMAMRRMSTRGFSVLMSLEPAIAAVAGLLLLGEQLSPLRWLAIAGIVAASFGSAAAGDAADPVRPPPD